MIDLAAQDLHLSRQQHGLLPPGNRPHHSSTIKVVLMVKKQQLRKN